MSLSQMKQFLKVRNRISYLAFLSSVTFMTDVFLSRSVAPIKAPYGPSIMYGYSMALHYDDLI